MFRLSAGDDGPTGAHGKQASSEVSVGNKNVVIDSQEFNAMRLAA